MKIGIIPTVTEKNKSIYYSIDKSLLTFLNKLFNKPKIKVLNDFNVELCDLIVSSGGNDLLKFSKQKKDKERAKIENYYLNLAIKKNIKFLAICYGAQFLAFKFGGKLTLDQNHVAKNHFIFSKNENKFLVNSFHNYKIIKISKKFNILFKSEDGSIEAFRHKEKGILGIMWHPERYKKIKKFDVKFIKKYL